MFHSKLLKQSRDFIIFQTSYASIQRKKLPMLPINKRDESFPTSPSLSMKFCFSHHTAFHVHHHYGCPPHHNRRQPHIIKAGPMKPLSLIFQLVAVPLSPPFSLCPPSVSRHPTIAAYALVRQAQPQFVLIFQKPTNLILGLLNFSPFLQLAKVPQR